MGRSSCAIEPLLGPSGARSHLSIVETLDILGDPEMVTALRDSLEDLKRGRLVSNAGAKKRLGV